MLRKFCYITLFFFTISKIYAIDSTWQNGSGGRWSDASNWSNGVVPNSSDAIATFPTIQYSSPIPIIVGSDSIIINGLIFYGTTDYLLKTGNYSLSGTSPTILLSSPAGSLQTISATGTTTEAVTINTLFANDSLVIDGSIGGTGGSIVKTGLGTLYLTGDNSYTGGTILTSGTLVLSGGAALGRAGLTIIGGTLSVPVGSIMIQDFLSGGGSVSLGKAANLIIQMQSDSTYSGAISGSGTMSTQGSNTLTLDGDNSSFFGTFDVAGAGGITIANPLAVNSLSNIAVFGGSTFTLEANLGTVTVGIFGGGGNVVINEGTTLVTTTSESSTYSGIMSGSGNFTKTGSSILKFTNIANSYTGKTSILDGSLVLSGPAIISASESVTVDGDLMIEYGSGAKSINTLSGVGFLRLNDNSITVTQNADATFSGKISGTGNFTKQGGSSLTISGDNIYSGSTIISSGALILSGDGSIHSSSSVALDGALTIETSAGEKEIRNLSGTGTINLNDNILHIDDYLNNTFSGTISGSGGIVKKGSGTFILSGENTFTGSTSILDGGITLSGAADSIALSTSVSISDTLTLASGAGNKNINTLSGSGRVHLNDNTLTVTQGEDGIFSGIIDGTGGLTKIGTETLFLSGDNTYTGTTTVQGGALALTGSIAGNASVVAGAVLNGTGTVNGSVTNTSGIVAPGNSIGTMNIAGNYTQDAFGTLEIEIGPNGESDVLSITGNASLDGAVDLLLYPGLYLSGSQYTFLTAASISGTFNALTASNGSSWLLSYPASTSVLLTASDSSIVLPVSLSSLQGNAYNIASYLFPTGFVPTNPDLISVYQKLLVLSPLDFSAALQRLGPTQFGALPLISLESDVRLASAMVDQMQNIFFCHTCLEKSRNVYDSVDCFWVEPLVYNYEQNGNSEQTGFNCTTFGADIGVSHYIAEGRCFVAAEIGYTNSSLSWQNYAGDGRWNTLYFGPAIGWLFDKVYLDIVLLGVVNFYNIDRKIVFPGLDRTANNKHDSYDIFLRTDGGIYFDCEYFFIQPEYIFSFLTVFEESYKENGADSLDLLVHSKTDYFIRPEIDVRIGYEFCKTSSCIFPSLKLGWVSNIPLSNSEYTASLFNQTFPTSSFTVKSFHSVTNQLVAGAEIGVKGARYTVIAGYEANVLDNNSVQEAKLRIEWWF